MKNKVKHIFKNLVPWLFDDNEDGKHYTSKKDAQFTLWYKNKPIGNLEHKDNKWVFEYSEDYKKDNFIVPLMDFPVIDKIYEYDELPPFFATRIPNLNQPFHQKKISKYKGDTSDIVSLLEIFGKKSINNPYLLVIS